MRINGEEFSFLHDAVDRQFVFPATHDDELCGGSFRPAILHFDCDLARITEELIPAFPFALDLLRDRGAVWGRFYLRRSSVLQRKWCGISGMFEIASQF